LEGEPENLLAHKRWGIRSAFLYVEQNTSGPTEFVMHAGILWGLQVGTLGYPHAHSISSGDQTSWLPDPAVVWNTLRRHPFVVAIRVADTVMPFRGIR
jgi:hypothetical protein